MLLWLPHRGWRLSDLDASLVNKYKSLSDTGKVPNLNLFYWFTMTSFGAPIPIFISNFNPFPFMQTFNFVYKLESRDHKMLLDEMMS